MKPYEECEDCVAVPFCKYFKGELTAPTHPNWCNIRFRLDKALILSSIPAAYRNANLFNFIVDENNGRAFEKMKPYIENIVEEVQKGRNVFFYSNKFGTGKTYLACLFLNHYIYKTCLTEKFDFESPLCMFIVYADLMDVLRYHKDEPIAFNTMGNIRDTPLLLLDDIGSGTMSDYVREQTYLILNHRFNNSLSTIVTSNLDAETLARSNYLGERNMSRIYAKCVGAKMDGGDKRRPRR